MESREERLEELRKILGKPSKVSPAKGRDLNELRQLLGKPLKDETAISKLQNHGIDATNNDEYTYGQRALQGVRGVAKGTGSLLDTLYANTKDFRRGMGPLGSSMSNLREQNFPHGVEKYLTSAVEKLSDKKLKPSDDDLTGKMIEGAGEFLSPIPGSGYIKLAQKGVKPIAKALGLDASTGAGVGMLREAVGKENQGYADLAGGIGIPFLAKRLAGNNLSGAEKRLQKYLQGKVGEEEIPNIISAIEKNNNPENFAPGYRPTLGEVADNPILAGEERAFAGRTTSPEFGKLSNRTIEQNQAILKTLNEMVPEGYDVHQAQDFVRSEYGKLLEDVAAAEEIGGQKAAQQILDDFQKRGTIQEAGMQVKRTIGDEIVEPIKDTRRKQATEDYAKIDESSERLRPENASFYIDKKLKNASGEIRTTLEEFRKDLKSRDNEFISKGGEAERIDPRIGELEGLRKAVEQKLSKEKHGSPLSAILTKLSKEIDKDLAPFSIVQEASANYKKNSLPLEPFVNHPTIGKDISRNVRKEFKTKDDKVINKYLKGDASEQYAKDLFPHIKNDKKTMDAIEGYINSKFIKEVIDSETGLVKKNKLDNFKTEYKGAFELYPGLETKLANSSNATKMYNDLVKTNANKIKDYQKNAAYKFLDRDPEKVASGVLAPNNNKSTMQMGEIVSELSKDKTGNALQGYQRSTAEHIMNDFRTLGEDNTNVSINKFNNLIKGKSKALGKLYNEEQMDTLGKIHNSLMARNKKYTLGKEMDSPTAPKLDSMLSVLIGKLGSVGTKLGSSTISKVGSFGLKKLSEYRNRKYNSLLIKAFLEPDFAKVMLTDIKNKKPKEVEALMSNYLKRSALRTGASLTKEEEEE